MKAATYNRYGGPEVIEIKDLPTPTPSREEILIQVKAVSLNSADLRLLRANPAFIRLIFGLFRPKNPLMGADFSGVVSQVGGEVTEFKVGDEVFGHLDIKERGSIAEYLKVKPNKVISKGPKLSHEESASLPLAGATALTAFKDLLNGDQNFNLKLNKDTSILVDGASGGVGSMILQLSVLTGAEVTAVCSSKNVKRIEKLGVNVIDYTKGESLGESPQKTYNRVFGVNGNRPLAQYRDLVKPGGTFVLVGSSRNGLFFEAMLRGKRMFKKSQKQFIHFNAEVNKPDLIVLKNLAENQNIHIPIDKTFPLDKTAEAFRYMEEGHPSGKVVITF